MIPIGTDHEAQRVIIRVTDDIMVSGLYSPPQAGTASHCLVYAPGAGSTLRDPFGVFLANAAPATGLALLRFQFPYAENGRRIPDRMPVLEATWRAALEFARHLAPNLLASGRSMGGRVASHVVAAGAEVAGLVLFAYPLTPPGRTTSRTAHLPAVTVPTLFCSGTRDSFSTPATLSAAAALCPRGATHFLAEADHGFAARRASGRSQDEVWQEAMDALVEWAAAL